MSKPVVLITGCSSGIGKELAFEFKRQGCRVFASARSVDKLGEIRSADIEVVQLDVANIDSIQRAVDEVISKAGRIDILVNNAGLSSYAPAIEVPLDEVRQLFETNFYGVVALTQAVAQRSMLPNRSGKIVMISSMMGEIVTPFNSTYAATKAALTRFSDAMRMELAPFGIHVTTVKPGGVRSEIANNAKGKVDSVLSGQSDYKPIGDYIVMRSQASQHHPMPTEQFASEVVSAVLKRSPPISMILGKNSSLLWWVAKLFPQWLSDFFFSRKFGLRKLAGMLRGQAETKKIK